MGRSFTHGAEIRRRADEAAAEMLQPDAIHKHPRNERVCAAGKPSREGEPATAGRELRIFLRQLDGLTGRLEHSKHAGMDGFLGLFRITAVKAVGDWNLVRRLGQDADEILRWFVCANLCDLRVYCLQVVRGLLVVLVEDT